VSKLILQKCPWKPIYRKLDYYTTQGYLTKVKLATLFGGCEVRRKIFFANQQKQTSFLYRKWKGFNIPSVQET